MRQKFEEALYDHVMLKREDSETVDLLMAIVATDAKVATHNYKAGVAAERARVLGLIGEDEPDISPRNYSDGEDHYLSGNSGVDDRNQLRAQLRQQIEKGE